ncbi:hypothetical protein LZ30DRAFT_782683 [Colletotrichum cereale]|nr:hypothetical protein LZ30DRAFT_782683 [Colletotrichum cereale]
MARTRVDEKIKGPAFNIESHDDGLGQTVSEREDKVSDREEVRNMIRQDQKDADYAAKEDENTPYELERDTNGYIIQWEFYETGTGSENYLKPVNESATDYRSNGWFPDQRTTLQNLKKGSDVILYRKRHPKGPRVRYVRIPPNNMKWVEEAIARYFHEESPTRRSPQVKTHSQMVLRPEYWRGQQHGGRWTTVRRMRAICEGISSNNPDKIVLFMPFLYWEEDRKRDKMAKTIEQETARTTAGGRNLLQAEPQLKFQYFYEVDEAHHRIINSTWQKNSLGRPNGKHPRNFVEFADGFIPGGTVEDEHVRDGRKGWHVAKLTCDKHGRVRPQNNLCQFLLDASRLYEAISMYRDQQLSYYWTLKSTKAPDRDQVVYRGMAMDDRNVHKLRKRQDDCKDQRNVWHLGNLLDRKKRASVEAPEEREAESRMGIYRWDGHWRNAEEKDIVCDRCRGQIRKVSRVVMVDQLWMWILDRQIIITIFPKRHRTNKSDPSGVHKSIRTRIKNARKNQIRSVFDVALIILDECSNTFFDRTKRRGRAKGQWTNILKDRHPQVIDIFAESVGSLQNKQTVSFQHLWHWTERASKIYNSKSKYEDTAHLHAPLLNITPEGKLQREIRDIIDELT